MAGLIPVAVRRFDGLTSLAVECLPILRASTHRRIDEERLPHPHDQVLKGVSAVCRESGAQEPNQGSSCSSHLLGDGLQQGSAAAIDKESTRLADILCRGSGD